LKNSNSTDLLRQNVINEKTFNKKNKQWKS
jgi:hypothetical protein